MLTHFRSKWPRAYFVTTPTSIINRLMGLETWTDPIALASGTTVGGQAIGGGTSSIVAVPAATTTLTITAALHAGKNILIASTAGLAITPPPATGTNNTYRISVIATITGGNLTWDAKAGNASDVFYGYALVNKVGTGITTFGTAANSNLMTWNGTTTGGILGDAFTLRDIATNVWQVEILGQGTGTIATPWSNH
jgi:hypothetical protein